MSHASFDVDTLAILSKMNSSTAQYNMYKAALSFDIVSFKVLFWAAVYSVVFSDSSKPSCTTSQASCDSVGILADYWSRHNYNTNLISEDKKYF